MKAGGALVSAIMVVVLGFFAFRILPGDPVRMLTADRRTTPEQMDLLREQFGLDDPIMLQFWNYLVDLFTGDLGYSFTYQQDVTQLIADRLLPTLLLTGASAALAVVLGLWIGQRAAWKRGSFFDNANMGIALTLWSVPHLLARGSFCLWCSEEHSAGSRQVAWSRPGRTRPASRWC